MHLFETVQREGSWTNKTHPAHDAKRSERLFKQIPAIIKQQLWKLVLECSKVVAMARGGG